MPWPFWLPTVQARLMGRPPEKFIQQLAGNSSISDVKLIRTDTTLDLSQKAEKGMKIQLPWPSTCSFYQRDRLLFEIRVIEWSDDEHEPISVSSGS